MMPPPVAMNGRNAVMPMRLISFESMHHAVVVVNNYYCSSLAVANRLNPKVAADAAMVSCCG